jgi:hypothetical protein
MIIIFSILSIAGCRAVAKLLNGHSKLLRLNLCNNLIDARGKNIQKKDIKGNSF